MNIRIPRGWEIPERLATPESVVLNRRALIGASAMLLPGVALGQGAAPAAEAVNPMAAMRNNRFPPERAITAEREATTYNNFYEFGTDKGIWRLAQRLPQRPWTLRIGGMVETAQELDIDGIIRRMPLEERVLRMRCVEGWAMTAVYTGFPLSELLKLAAPTAAAKYVVFETAADRANMPGLRQSWYPWPYKEGCTIAEAANEMAFVVVGMYGKPCPPQNGGPIRVVFPWKFGFKHGKSLARITLSDQRPVSYWEQVQGAEYGFWANVNPEVPHPRWSQATERLLGTNERVPTRIFNGYGEFVADMYRGMERERLWA